MRRKLPSTRSPQIARTSDVGRPKSREVVERLSMTDMGPRSTWSGNGPSGLTGRPEKFEMKYRMSPYHEVPLKSDTVGGVLPTLCSHPVLVVFYQVTHATSLPTKALNVLQESATRALSTTAAERLRVPSSVHTLAQPAARTGAPLRAEG